MCLNSRLYSILTSEMNAYPMLTFMQSFVKFQNMDPEIQKKDEVYSIFSYILLLG